MAVTGVIWHVTPERWKDVERLYFTALERPAGERTEFLEHACQGDKDLRYEVESLLRHESEAKNFIKTAAGGYRPPIAEMLRHQHWVPGRFVGRDFGPYRLEALIAAGGSGEIYRGLDVRVQRSVAVKILHSRFSTDYQWRERFRREARVISSLNHPNICTLFDVGSQEGTDYLVMEFVKGETLRQRLAMGPLPLAFAMEHALQILDALAFAHQAGFVHRDLKPENIMLTTQGVKVLDFGLATRMESGPQTESSSTSSEGSLIFGSPGYCAPEQLERRSVDARTDIFSFGLVLYEMVTGRPAFAADNLVRLFGATLFETPPDVSENVLVPKEFTLILNRCIAKEPGERWQSTLDLRFALQAFGSAKVEPKSSVQPTKSRSLHWMAASGLLSLVAIVTGWAWRFSRQPVSNSSSSPDVRLSISPPGGTQFYSGYDVPFALSPDGKRLAFLVVNQQGVRQICVRSMVSEAEEFRNLRGTEGAQTPFWSPDGEWIGFFAANSLKKIRVAHESVQIVASPAFSKGGASWNRSDVILFPSIDSEKISRVSARGGEVVSLGIRDDSPGSQFFPQFLSDGKTFLYVNGAGKEMRIGSIDRQSSRLLMRFPLRVSSVAYVRCFVFYVQDGTLFARPFDENQMRFTGEAARIVDHIPVTPPGHAPFSVSESGVLAYWHYPGGLQATLDWFDRAGHLAPAVTDPAQYVGISFSPDATRLAFSRRTRDGGADVWIRDLNTRVERQLTFDKAAFGPHWSPRGTRLVYSGPGLEPPPKPFVLGVDGTGAGTVAGSWTSPAFGSAWTPDESAILVVRFDSINRNDLWLQPLAPHPAVRLAVNTSANESEGSVSPDGRWLAYVSDQSGRDEVWLARFPDGQDRRQISTGGGVAPRWRADGRELFYVSADRHLMALTFPSTTPVQEITPIRLFAVNNMAEADYRIMPGAGFYEPSPDGQRFLIAQRWLDRDAPPIRVIANWRAINRAAQQ